MPAFDATGNHAPAATTTTLIITGSATLRTRISHVRMGTTGAPTSDASVEVYARPSTAAGTTTAVTPRPRNGVSVAGSTAGSNATIEPTYTAGQPLLEFVFNPRNFAQWMAYNPDAELNAISASANGIGFQIQIAGGALTTVETDSDIIE
jgi:hypothetical protein